MKESFLVVLMVILALADSSALEATAGTMKTSSSDPVQVTDPIEDMSVDFGTESTVIELTGRFDDPVFDLVRFNFSTELLGSVDVQLFETETPLTVSNFLNYVNSGSYVNSFIHRSVPGFVIQGGGFAFNVDNSGNPGLADYTRIPTFTPVENEAGIPNDRATIAMAKTAGNPDSATSQWFFNLVANPGLDEYTNNGGYTVFGKVINDGMSVIDYIATFKIWNAFGINSAFNTLPLINYDNSSGILPGEADLVMVYGIDQISELSFTADSDKPDLVMASVVDNALHLDFSTNHVCVVKITVRATALDGRFVEDFFTVVIGGDLDGDGEVSLADAILALSVQTGMHPAGLRPDYSSSGADINEDDRIGTEEALFVLSVVSESW
jgi:peptidyl-prolyl cis-trans isomerase A (cyclophilin A)